MAYRIKNWDQHYETSKTRILKNLTWLALPIALHSDGYTELMEKPDGATYFGVFVAILEVAAGCNPRGTLMRGTGVPHDALSLARMCRIPAPLVQQALDRLVTIGWIETWHHQGTMVPDEGPEVPDEGPDAAPECRQPVNTGRPVDRPVGRDTGIHEGEPDAPSAQAPDAPAREPGEDDEAGRPRVWRDQVGRLVAKP